ncbi:unnamed protein product [Ilex paraguariensis]|uniref:Uncharacterized protein n=1 Tax=Ilex paraguariensis TaxID=185542 RepID=A0ABC8QY85_9AQUA
MSKETMKKKVEHEHEHEILKAVAQAWHGHSSSGSSTTTSEFDTHRRNFKSKPTRFKLEAMSKATAKESGSGNWDFGQSLWDSYELVTLSKKLEAGLVLDHQFSSLDPFRIVKRRKESKNSLRNLIGRMSAKRFDDADIVPHEEGTQF